LLSGLLDQIRACSHCAAHLPGGVRPVVQAGERARVLIIGQAPGSKVHASGIAWDDDSGDRLRGWLGFDKARFYDPQAVALMPMGFCYPGKGKGGDLPPRPECSRCGTRRCWPPCPICGLLCWSGNTRLQPISLVNCARR